MLLVLVLLCVFLSWITWDEQIPTGAAAGESLARDIVGEVGPAASVLIVARDTDEDRALAEGLERGLAASGVADARTVVGGPPDAGKALHEAEAAGGVGAIACPQAVSEWPVFADLASKHPRLSATRVWTPRGYYWPNFLKAENLLNVASQIVVIAVVAIGMTMVIVTGGIDLSVGSLIALAAVLASLLIRDVGGAESASAGAMIACCAGAVALCGAVGAFSGLAITAFAIPPFVATLGMMLVASGAAYILAGGQSIYQIPDSFIWLGRGTALGGLPNSVALMAILYAAAHVVMTRTPFGRSIYAVGGNGEAARLSGVPVRRVLVLVYTLCGALAGLGGVITASQLKSGSPTYGQMYELYVIAAVVVGGASLTGGEGRVLGTLIGAFIIAVIQNGMNLTGVESYTQKIVLGAVILGAVLLDALKRRGFASLRREG